MDIQDSIKNLKTQLTQIARYMVLILPIAWIVFSVWIVTKNSFPFSANSGKTLESAGFSGVLAFVVFGDIVFRVIRNMPVPIGVKSSLLFYVSIFLLAISPYLPLDNYLFYLVLALTNIHPVLAIVILLQGKPFTTYALLFGEVQIKK